MFGKSENRDDYQDTSRPVAAMARDLADKHVIGAHSHRRGQLLYGTGGAISVTTPVGTWVVPPHRAVWVPPRVTHAMRAHGMVPMRTLYIEPGSCQLLPAMCAVMSVSKLLRELIVEATQLPVDYDESGRDGLVMSLLLDELAPEPMQPLQLPLPDDPEVRELCERVIEDPSSAWSTAEAAEYIHVSERTLNRKFRNELACTFGWWRQQARLLAAVERLAQGESVLHVATSLSYASPSAFSAMFRRALGMSPTAYFADR